MSESPLKPSVPELKRHWLLLALVWILTLALQGAIYAVAQRLMVDEFRYQAMGVAGATAASINPDDLDLIHAPDDNMTEAYYRIQTLITRVAQLNDDVRYVYVMRRATGSNAKPSDFIYVVDQASYDDNQDGVIDREEITEETGTPYDASRLPEMVKGWDEASADLSTSPDPPYPDILSGYSPIKNAQGVTVGMVGADITARTIGQKMLALRIVTAASWILLALLISALLVLYLRQRSLVAERERLIRELTEAMENVKTLSGLLPICASCKKIRNDEGYWEQIESFVAEKSDAEFSHSICPDCIKKLYPEIK